MGNSPPVGPLQGPASLKDLPRILVDLFGDCTLVFLADASVTVPEASLSKPQAHSGCSGLCDQASLKSQGGSFSCLAATKACGKTALQG